MYTLLYLKWITNKDILWSTGNSGQCYVAAWVGEEFGERIYVYVWLSPFTVHLETITTLLITCTAIQKSLKKKNKWIMDKDLPYKKSLLTKNFFNMGNVL